MTSPAAPAPPPDPAPLNRALRLVHRSVLLLLGVCAGVIGTVASGDGPREAPAGFTLTAVGLAAGAILSRRVAGGPTGPRAIVTRTVASLGCAGALGLLGVGLALAHGQRDAALLYTLGGAILALRPPPRIEPPPAEPTP